MKKLLLLFIIFISSFFILTKIHGSSNKTETMLKSIVHVPIDTPTPTPIPVGTPVSISIPAIGLHTTVESVGMDSQGRMGVPQNVMDTAWYKYGYRPGEKGSAVIDGHYDTVTGAPASFYNISKLQQGDTISVTDTNNRAYTFTITQVTSYPYNQLPMQEIFASTDKARLNLITCDGTWNRATHNYSNRAVVYAELAP